MAKKQTALVRRALVQMDLAFWCLHEHPLQLAVLGLPTLLSSGLLAVLITTVARTWSLPGGINFFLYGVLYPWLALLIVTFAPLPGAVFVWHRAAGDEVTVGQCFRRMAGRLPRLLASGVPLAMLFWGSMLLLGLPLLFFWPRTCLVPYVALFEKDLAVFRRSRRLLRQEFAIIVLAFLNVCLLAVLAGFLFLPRILLETNAFGMKLFEVQWTRLLREYLWIGELLGCGILLCAMALCWCISLTLLYREIRRVREGEELRDKIDQIRGKYGEPEGSVSSGKI
jgi:hypothetical protein